MEWSIQLDKKSCLFCVVDSNGPIHEECDFFQLLLTSYKFYNFHQIKNKKMYVSILLLFEVKLVTFINKMNRVEVNLYIISIMYRRIHFIPTGFVFPYILSIPSQPTE